MVLAKRKASDEEVRSLQHCVFWSALSALREEPLVWPRFGLVGPNCAGSHADMDYRLLLLGTEPVARYASVAFALGCRVTDSSHGFCRLRRMGGVAEQQMLRATFGVNTHKGSIFLLGLLSYALGQAVRHNSHITLANLFAGASGVSRSELIADLTTPQRPSCETYGERAYRKYGLLGVRGEAINGFGRLYDAMYWLANMAQGNRGVLYGQARLYFLASCEDTNIIKRVGLAGALDIRQMAAEALKSGGMFHEHGISSVRRLEDFMLRAKCSAAAAGDMIILVIFLERLGHYGFLNWQGHLTRAQRTVRDQIRPELRREYSY